MLCLQLESSLFVSPLGNLKVVCCVNGVHSISLPNVTSCVQKEINPYIKQGNGNQSFSSQHMKDVTIWLESYFDSKHLSETSSLPTICPSVISAKGSFTEKVWVTLLQHVPFGKTISYGHLAKLSGNAAASRAVGTAMKNNPIPILIPCHRVLKHDGSIGQYSGGKNIKQWLLNHEKV